MKRVHENGSKKDAIWKCSKTPKLAPRAGESTILGFKPFPKMLHFAMVLDPHFGIFVNSIRRKQGF